MTTPGPSSGAARHHHEGVPLESFAPEPAGSAGGGYSLPYYRLRVESLDQGDWANLNLGDPDEVVKVRQMELVGNPNVLSIERTHLGLNTNLGEDLRVVVDYALVSEAIDSPFELSIEKGVAGTVTVRVWSGAVGQLRRPVPADHRGVPAALAAVAI